MTEGAGPYAQSAWLYRRAGWAGVLPLPPGAKWPPPGGYTGWAGVDPSGADVQAWVDGPEGAGNVALRLPAGVFGLDVDAYGGKTGGEAFRAAEGRLGPLPPTWLVTSRDDGISGIRLFRATLPEGRRWKDEPAGHGAGIEAIHLGHRYAVVWPSVHPNTGAQYAWQRADGTWADAQSNEVPLADPLPELPAAWVEALSEPGEVRTGEQAGHEETVAAVTGFPAGQPCPRTEAAAGRGQDRLEGARGGDALHPAGRDAVHELVNLGHEGHAGTRGALARHFDAFVEVRNHRGDDRGKAEAEWWRLVRGAVGKLVGSAAGGCDCALLAGEGVLFEPGPAAGDDPEGGEGGAGGGAQRSTWAPVDMRDVVAGTRRVPEPTIGQREDGVGLLYPSKEHVVNGEPETGKTWLTGLLVAQELERGGRVVYVDFEDDEGAVGGRLLDLGADGGVLVDYGRFRYVRPAEAGRSDLWAALLRFGGEAATLVILDGTTEGYSLHGWEVNGQEDAAKWRHAFIRPALDLGAATLATDHVTKDKEARNGFSIGAQHKKAGLTGVLFELENVEPLGRGLLGRSELLIHKDRPGGLRRHGVRAEGRPRVTHFADLILNSTGMTIDANVNSRLLCSLKPIAKLEDGRPATDPLVEKGQHILAILRQFGPHSGTRLEAAVRGKAQTVRQAVEYLHHLGQVCRGRKGAKGTPWHLPTQCNDELHPERYEDET